MKACFLGRLVLSKLEHPLRFKPTISLSFINIWIYHWHFQWESPRLIKNRKELIKSEGSFSYKGEKYDNGNIIQTSLTWCYFDSRKDLRVECIEGAIKS